MGFFLIQLSFSPNNKIFILFSLTHLVSLLFYLFSHHHSLISRLFSSSSLLYLSYLKAWVLLPLSLSLSLSHLSFHSLSFMFPFFSLMISRYLVVVFLFLILEPKLYFRSIDSDDSLSLSLLIRLWSLWM